MDWSQVGLPDLSLED
jgi:hypothetical protein